MLPLLFNDDDTMNDFRTEKPFSCDWVLAKTITNMKENIDLSIRITFDRQKEFTDNPKKQSEIFETLSLLHTMRKIIDDFQHNNSRKEKEQHRNES